MNFRAFIVLATPWQLWLTAPQFTAPDLWRSKSSDQNLVDYKFCSMMAAVLPHADT